MNDDIALRVAIALERIAKELRIANERKLLSGKS